MKNLYLLVILSLIVNINMAYSQDIAYDIYPNKDKSEKLIKSNAPKVKVGINFYNTDILFKYSTDIYIQSLDDTSVLHKYNTSSGVYDISDLQPGTYKAYVYCNEVVYLGISTLDLVLIQKHLLRLKEFTEPYSFFAADIRKDDEINILDVIQGNRVILGVFNHFPKNTSWRFEDKNQKFDPAIPYMQQGLKEEIIFTIDSSDIALNFYAIKVGDLNKNSLPIVSHTPVNLENSEDEFTVNNSDSLLVMKNHNIDNSKKSIVANDTVSLFINDKVINDSIVCLPVQVKGFSNISGFQFSINFDKNILKFNTIKNNAFENILTSTSTNDNELLVIWTGFKTTLPENSALFDVCFEVLDTLGITNISFNSTSNFKTGFFTEYDPIPFRLKSGQLSSKLGCTEVQDVNLPENYRFSPVSMTADEMFVGENINDKISITPALPEYLDCDFIGKHYFTIMVDRNNGIVDTCLVTLNIIDKYPPKVEGKNSIVIHLPDSLKLNLTPDMFYSSASDNCGIASYKLDHEILDCNSDMPTFVNLTVNDNSGNQTIINTKVYIYSRVNNYQLPLCKERIEVTASDESRIEIKPDMVLLGNYGCNVFYSLQLFETFNLSIPRNDNFISKAEAGKTFLAKIRNVSSTEECWSNVVVLGDTSLTYIEFPIMNITPDSSFYVDVKAKNLHNVGILHLNLYWNNAVIKFEKAEYPDSIQGYDLIYVTKSHNDGINFYAIKRANANSTTSFNGDILIKLFFKAIGEVGNWSPITVLNNDSYITSTFNTNLPFTTIDGIIRIIQPVCTRNVTVNLNSSNSSLIIAKNLYKTDDPNDIILISGQPSILLDCKDIGHQVLPVTIRHQNNSIDSCFIGLTLNDTIPPIAKIKTELNLSLGSNHYLPLTPAMFDDGSTDNCEIVSKMISPDYLDCNSINDGNVMLQIRDRSGNRSFAYTKVNIIPENQGQVPIQCYDEILVNINQYLNVQVTPDMLLKSEGICYAYYKFKLYEDIDLTTLHDSNILTYNDIGKELYAKSIEVASGNFCVTKIVLRNNLDNKVELKIDKKVVRYNVPFKISVRGSNLYQITSFQFGITYDNKIIQLDSIKFPSSLNYLNDKDLTYSIFNSNVKIIYLPQNSSNSFNLLDSNELIDLYFTPIGDAGKISYLNFYTNFTFPVKFKNNFNENLTYQLDGGYVKISCRNDLTEDKIIWPCDFNFALCRDKYVNVDTTEMIKMGVDKNCVVPIIINSCPTIRSFYTTNVENRGDSLKCIRHWTITDGLDSFEHDQFFNLIFKIISQEFVCDTLPWNTPLGSCGSGHTLEDIVEWPANITISTTHFEPSSLLTNTEININDAAPRLSAECGNWILVYDDKISYINGQNLLISRKWTIKNINTNESKDYYQKISVVDLQLSGNACSFTMKGYPISEVKMFENSKTDSTGCTDLANIQLGNQITPIKTGSIEDGLDIIDFQLLQEYLLGYNGLTKSQKLTADISYDGHISTIDLVWILNSILGKEIPESISSWTFLNSECPILNETQFQFPDDTCSTFLDYEGNEFLYSFTGLKKGDLNFSYGNPEFIDKSKKANFEIEDLALSKGETYNIDLLSDSNYAFEGIQAFLNLDTSAIEVIGISSSKIDDFMMSLNSYQHYTNLSLVYVTPINFIAQVNSIHLTPGESILTFTIKAKKNCLLHNTIFENENRFNLLKDFNGVKPYEFLFSWKNLISNTTELASQNEMLIYPQPAHRDIIIKYPQNFNSRKIEIFNLMGTKVIEIDNSKEKIDVSSLISGIYIVLVTDIDGKIVKSKFIKN